MKKSVQFKEIKKLIPSESMPDNTVRNGQHFMKEKVLRLLMSMINSIIRITAGQIFRRYNLTSHIGNVLGLFKLTEHFINGVAKFVFNK